MKIEHILYFPLSLLLLFSCTRGGKSAVEQLQIENDSLRAVQTQLESDFEYYFTTMNEVADNLDKIKSIGGYLSQQTTSEVASKAPQTRIDENIQLVAALINQNNEKIKSLNDKMTSSLLANASLEERINQLTVKNNILVQEIIDLQQRLGEKEELIVQQRVEILSAELAKSAAEAEINEKESELARVEEQLYKGWYVFGTENELKSQDVIDSRGGLLSKRVLSGDFNQDYFISVDIRELSRIPLYARHAKILTIHPDNSYKLEKEDKTYVLNILDKEAFWSVSRFLVIKTN